MQIVATFLDANRPLIDAIVAELGQRHPELPGIKYPTFMITRNDRETQLSTFAEEQKLTPLETFVLGSMMIAAGAKGQSTRTGDANRNIFLQEIGKHLVAVGARPWEDRIGEVQDSMLAIFQKAGVVDKSFKPLNPGGPGI